MLISEVIANLAEIMSEQGDSEVSMLFLTNSKDMEFEIDSIDDWDEGVTITHEVNGELKDIFE
ncbi:MAG: hypothetical protein ACOCUI_03360 [bacterium]